MRLHISANIEVWINDFPEVPRIGDNMSMGSLCPDKVAELMTQDQFDELSDTEWTIGYVSWMKDKEGYYLYVSLSEE